MSKMLDIVRGNLEAKQSERAAKFAELEELPTAATTEARALTDDESAKADSLVSTIKSIDAEIDALRAREAELVEVEQRATAAATAPTFIRKADAPTPTDVARMSRIEARDAAMRTLDAASSYLVTDRNKERIEGLMATRNSDLDGDVIAKRLLLTENESYRSGFIKAVTRSAPVFTADEARALAAFDEFRAASIGTDAAGGFGVPVLIDPSVVISSGAADSPILRIARVETITNDEWKGVSAQGAAWSWDGEASVVSDDMVTLAQPTVVAHKVQGFIPYSIEVGMDYPAFAAEMSKVLAQGYLDALAAAFATGSGSSQPFGIFTALDANTNVEVVVTTDGAFGAVDIDKVWAALPERFRTRATWFMNVDVENEIRGFGSGTATSRFTVDQTEAGISRLNGRPVVLSDYAPTFTGTTGASNILVVGDFSNYLIAQRAGMSVELVPHLFDVTNNRPTGSRGWYAWARVGADSIVDNGFRLLQNT